MTTIFDRILDGDIPCHRVLETEHVLAFLDIGPLSRGHTLVIRMADSAADFVGSYCADDCFPTRLFDGATLPSGNVSFDRPRASNADCRRLRRLLFST